MSTAWAGDFSCSECGRKRLIAADFSKSQVQKRQKDPEAKLKCKACVEKCASDERAAAAARQQAAAATLPAVLPTVPMAAMSISEQPTLGAGACGTLGVLSCGGTANSAAAGAGAAGGAAAVSPGAAGGAATAAQHECSACKRALGPDAFNRTQLCKGPGKMRCRECVEKAEKETAGARSADQQAQLEEAKAALKAIEKTGTALEVAAAFAKVAAAEGQLVTGIKPMILGRGRGRGRGGSWRGRG